MSFTLTIIVALRARRVRFEQWKPLAKLVMTHFLTRPSDFFWPPKQPLELEENAQANSGKKQNIKCFALYTNVMSVNFVVIVFPNVKNFKMNLR